MPSSIKPVMTPMPNGKQLAAIVDTAIRSPQGADYAATRTEVIYKSHLPKLEKAPEQKEAGKKMVVALYETAEYTHYKYNTDDDRWAGKPPEKPESKMHSGITAKTLKELTTKQLQQVVLDYAINSEGHFIRGYAKKEGDSLNQLDVNTEVSFDKMFNTWLFKKHGVITEEGYFIKDGVRLTAEKIDELMSTDEFKDYLKENGGYDLESREQDYGGGDTRLQDKKARAEAAIESGTGV